MMGLPDGRKKFSDKFSRFDTIPAVTDSQPATQPTTQPDTLRWQGHRFLRRAGEKQTKSGN